MNFLYTKYTMQEFLKKILSLDFLRKRQTSVLGIDIGSSSIKVVQLRKKGGRAVLETYGELALGPYSQVEVGRATNMSQEKLGQALGDLLREAKTTTKTCGVAIPTGSSLISLIELPPVDEKQFEQMIPLEARKYIPVPISEVTLDWWIIPQSDHISREDEPEKKEKVEALIVAIHNEVINKYEEVLKATSLEPSFIEIEIFSTIRALIGNELGTVAIFDMGASSTKISIVERGVVKSSHTINRGSQDVTMALSTGLSLSVKDAENMKRGFGTSGVISKEAVQIISLTLDYVFSETNRILLDYERKNQKTIGKLLLTGGGVGYDGLLELAQKNFQIEVALGDPFSKIEFPAFLENTLKETGPEFAVAVGVALRKLQELG